MVAPVNPGQYPVAAGQPSYSGVFIPIIWSTKFIVKYYAKTVFGAIANTMYEGEIKNFGDTIYIPLVPDMVIRQYIDGQNLEIDRPEGDNIEMKIQRGQYFNSLITDIQKKQSSIPFLDKWSSDAAEKMNIRIDKEMLGAVYADAHLYNAGATAGAISQNIDLGSVGSPLAVGPTNIIDVITQIGQVLDEQNVPQDAATRWFVLPAWMRYVLMRSELKQAYLTGDSTSPTRNGEIGRIDNFGTFYQSNNLATVVDGTDTVTHVIAGNKDAITFASQMTQMETIRAQSTFGDLMRGLQVYDFKVLKPEALVHLYCYFDPDA